TMPTPDAEKLACLATLAAAANLNGDPTPVEFEAFLAALTTFQPLPMGVTPERLLSAQPSVDPQLGQITTPELQQQLYRGVHSIARSKGIDAPELALLAKLRSAFGFSPELAESLAKQPLAAVAATSATNSTLTGMAALIGREGDVRRLIFDYAMGAAIVGLIPLHGGGSLEIKLLVVLVLVLKMIWDIRNYWGRPSGQGVLAVIGNLFGFMAAVLGGFLAWVTLIGLGVVIPYAGAFAKAAGFATATWIAGQSTSQFYTSQKRPDLTALKRAFPALLSSDQ
ncbi:hypothetical protein IQ254_27695, partial [Nodosilinea sp. LEGE 07088]|uniref:hypothetical protein n=1 Tax=Nodosilinea sp. LEGE 07088 TaxID=2777968 RepID=UPI001881B49F